MADLELGLSLTGVDEAVRNLNRVRGAQDDVARAAQNSGRATAQTATAAGTALRGAGTEARSVGQSVQQMASRVQGAASAVATLTNALGGSTGGRAAGLIGSMAGAVAQGAALGATFGPQGALIGGVIGAVAAIAQLAGTHRDAAQAAREQAAALREAAQAAIDQRRAAGVQAAIREGVGGSGLSPEAALQERELRLAEVRRLEEQRFAADAPRTRRLAAEAAAELETSTRSTRRLATQAAVAEREAAEAAGRRIRELRQEIEFLNTVISAAPTATEVTGRQDFFALDPALQAAVGRARSVGPGFSDAPQRQSPAAARAAARAQEERDRGITTSLLEASTRGGSFVPSAEAAAGTVDLGEALEQSKRAAEEARDATKEAAFANHELAVSALEAAEAFETGYVDSIDTVVERWREANAQLRQSGQGMISTGRLLERAMVSVGNNIADTIGGTMRGAFEDALGAWLDGSKSFEQAAADMAKGVIRALVIESIVQAVVETARGIADLANRQYDTAVLHFAAAGAWAAVGGVAGAVGAGIGAFGGGGGAEAREGGGGRDLSSRSISEKQSTAPIIVNVYPGWASDREKQQFVYGAIDGGARDGRRIDSRALRGTGRE